MLGPKGLSEGLLNPSGSPSDNGTTVLAYLLYSMMTSITHDYVAERVVQIKNKPAHITHIEYSFHLSLFRPSETPWFGRDNGTTVLAYLLYSMMYLGKHI